MDENIEKIEKKARVVEICRNMEKIFCEETKDSNCDKNGIGFCLDDRFSAFIVTISFDSWRGFYGNSGCSNVISFPDKEIVKKALIKFLNEKKYIIFSAVADIIEKEISEERKKAISDLKKIISTLEKFDN